MRLIDADALIARYKGNILTAQIDYAEGCRDIITDIKKAPTIDAVEVVRCKDCIFHQSCKYEQHLGLDGFCSYGERRNDV